jgi:hypothetical protein
MARPKKQTGDKRAQVMQARVSPAEHAEILLRAAKASVSPSEFLRRSALSVEVVVQQGGPSDFETADQLRRIGVNLNQLARVANKTGYMPDGLEEALAKVDQLLDRMIEL